MENFLLEDKIIKNQKDIYKIKELYHLISSYNAYILLLLKAKGKELNIKNNTNCYENQIDNLFSLFTNNECLKLNQLVNYNNKDMLFLINQNTLFRIHNFNIINSTLDAIYNINYQLLNIKNNKCKTKIYDETIYYNDPYYYSYNSFKEKSLGIFCDNKLITPSYRLDDQLIKYDNMDIREILQVQSFEDIYNKITKAKEEKIKKLLK